MDELKDGIHRVHREAAGVLAIEIIRYSDLPELLFAAAAGDEIAMRTIEILGKFLDGVGRAPRRRSILCAGCTRALRRSRFACVIAWPSRDDPSAALCLGVCDRCAPDGSIDGVTVRAQEFLRRIWPASRVLDPGQVHVGGGQA